MLEAVRFVFKEHMEHKSLILKMAIVNMNKQTLRTSLGVYWQYLHDFVYFFVFVLFRVLMAGSGEIDGIHNVVYLVTGIIPWFFISEVLNVGSSSIKSYRAIIQSIKFPITVIPTIEVIAIFFKRLPTFIFIFAVSIIYHYIGRFNLILFLYYMFCMFVFMHAFTLLISAIVAVSSDFQQLYLVTIRVLMYTMPIVWGYKHIAGKPALKVLIHVNPMVYILGGFRDAFATGDMPNLIYSAYFWGSVVFLFCVGSFLQYKLRRYYADLM